MGTRNAPAAEPGARVGARGRAEAICHRRYPARPPAGIRDPADRPVIRASGASIGTLADRVLTALRAGVSACGEMTSTATADRPSAPMPRHAHPVPPWPLRPGEWDELATCQACGMGMLRVFVRSSTWVVRRVEKVTFLDERTVRRQVSIDYSLPDDAIALGRGERSPVRVVPLTMMRRKSLINFDLRDEDDRSLSLLGLREAQALTLAIARAWARRTLRGEEEADPPLPGDVDRTVVAMVRGDQTEMQSAFETMWSPPSPVHAALAGDPWFMGLMERLAGNFIPFTTDEQEPGTRRVVKFSYDEPLTLRYSRSGYRRHGKGGARREAARSETHARLWGFAPAPLLAGIGLRPTLIRFAIPSAELAGSYHFEVTAPPEVSIVDGSVLAGLPELYLDADPARDRDLWDRRAEDKWAHGGATAQEGPALDDERLRRRPSYDSVRGGYPTVDLHVVDVPYGSRCRAQVALQANTTGWLSAAMVGAWAATGTLAAASFGVATKEGAGGRSPVAELGTVVLATFAAALVAVLVRPDPHRMVTRLLTLLRFLAGSSAVLTLVAAVMFAFFSAHSDEALRWLWPISLVPSVVVTAAFVAARLHAGREARRPRDRQSPWEQHAPRRDESPTIKGGEFHTELAKVLDDADHPYDTAVKRLRFDRPAIKVASSEGGRVDFPWTRAFRETFYERLLP
jgi:hypothetical protein